MILRSTLFVTIFDAILFTLTGCKLMQYCSVECQASDWTSSHRAQCEEFQRNRKRMTAWGRAEGKPQKNRHFVHEWYTQNPRVALEASNLAWKHRKKDERHFIVVETFDTISSSGVPAGTPQLTAVPKSHLGRYFGNGDFVSTFHKNDFDADDVYTVCFILNHSGTETWPQVTLTMGYPGGAATMEARLLITECVEANTFHEKVAAQSAFHEHKVAHPQSIADLAAAGVPLARFTDICGCLRELIEPAYLNNTLGFYIPEKEPKDLTTYIVHLVSGHAPRVPKDNFEFLRMGTGRVRLEGLIGAMARNT